MSLAIARLKTRFGRPSEAEVFDRKNMRPVLRVATILIACFLSAAPAAAEPLPRTVLVLHQSIPYTEFFGKLFASFQLTLKAGSTIPITIYSESLRHRHFGRGIRPPGLRIHQVKISLKTSQRHCCRRLRCPAICGEPASRARRSSPADRLFRH
jgi:hypothetical protein